MAKTKKYAAGGSLSPDEIVAEIDRRQNEEDKDLLPRIGRTIKNKVNEDLTGGAYVGSRLNMPSNTRLGKASPSDTRLLNEQDATLEGQKAATARMRRTNPELFDYETMKKYGGSGMKKGGTVKKAKGGRVSTASKRGDGCCIKGKTKGRMV
jgi:hypothetical protein